MKYIALDTETGGLDPARHALLQIGCITQQGERLSVYIEPAEGITVTAGAARVNGWPASHAGKNSISEPAAMDALAAFLARTKPDWILCHHAAFDVPFIRAAMARTGHTFYLPRPICTMSVAAVLRHCGGAHFEKFNLDALRADLCPSYNRPANHDASDDAEITHQCMVEMLARFDGMVRLANGAAMDNAQEKTTTQRTPARRMGFGSIGR